MLPYELPSLDYSLVPEAYSDLQVVAPANCGLLLRGEPGQTVKLVSTLKDSGVEETPYLEHNMLVAVTEPRHVEPTEGEYTNFMLKDGKFIKIAAADESSKMPANKAYLQIPTAVLTTISETRGILLRWDNEHLTTGIGQLALDDVQPTMDDVDVYDLQGHKLSERPVQKGVYVTRPKQGGSLGKKIVVK
jgi:hypothetical protein